MIEGPWKPLHCEQKQNWDRQLAASDGAGNEEEGVGSTGHERANRWEPGPRVRCECPGHHHTCCGSPHTQAGPQATRDRRTQIPLQATPGLAGPQDRPEVGGPGMGQDPPRCSLTSEHRFTAFGSESATLLKRRLFPNQAASSRTLRGPFLVARAGKGGERPWNEEAQMLPGLRYVRVHVRTTHKPCVTLTAVFPCSWSPS